MRILIYSPLTDEALHRRNLLSMSVEKALVDYWLPPKPKDKEDELIKVLKIAVINNYDAVLSIGADYVPCHDFLHKLLKHNVALVVGVTPFFVGCHENKAQHMSLEAVPLEHSLIHKDLFANIRKENLKVLDNNLLWIPKETQKIIVDYSAVCGVVSDGKIVFPVLR